MTQDKPAAGAVQSEQEILLRMLDDADRLCRSHDPLLVGQYQFLRGRISALIKINEAATGAGGA